MTAGRAAYDAIIVGGGVAGTACALALAPGGYRMLLLERARFPREKPCGEGLMPHGVRVLERLGVRPDVLAHAGARPFRGIRYRNRRGRVAEAAFPTVDGSGAMGLAICRRDLDTILLERVKALGTVTVREGWEVARVLQKDGAIVGVAGHPVGHRGQDEAFRAPLVIGADGRHSVFHRQGVVCRRYLPRRRFAVTGHVADVESDPSSVEVLLCDWGEAYVAPAGASGTLVALLLESAAVPAFRGQLARRYLAVVRSGDVLGERAAGARLSGPVRAVGPLGYRVSAVHRPGALLVGDSAGFLDPLTGDGMALAMATAVAAAPLVARAFDDGDFGAGLGRRYRAARRRVVRSTMRLTRLLLALSRHRAIADAAVEVVRRYPGAMRQLLGVVAAGGWGSSRPPATNPRRCA